MASMKSCFDYYAFSNILQFLNKIDFIFTAHAIYANILLDRPEWNIIKDSWAFLRLYIYSLKNYHDLENL